MYVQIVGFTFKRLYFWPIHTPSISIRHGVPIFLNENITIANIFNIVFTFVKAFNVPDSNGCDPLNPAK